MIHEGTIICDNCGADLDYVLVDGYAFGDRTMEGVMFKARLSNMKEVDGKRKQTGWTCIGVREEDEAYMKQFDWNYWSNLCEEYCERNDLAQCPLCGEEEVLVEAI